MQSANEQHNNFVVLSLKKKKKLKNFLIFPRNVLRAEQCVLAEGHFPYMHLKKMYKNVQPMKKSLTNLIWTKILKKQVYNLF